MNPQELTIKLNPCKKDPIDYRDFDAREVMGASKEEIPTRYRLKDDVDIKIEDQDGSGSCVAQAVSKYLEVLEQKENTEFTDLSARFIYSLIYLKTGGSYIRRGMKTAVEKGDSLEELCPSYPATEKDLREEPDAEAFENAKIYQSKAYAKDKNKHDISFMARMIYENHGFVTGAIISSEGWQDAFVRPPTDDEDTGGHAIYCTGYDLEKGRIYFVNSWGKDWGNDGFGYFDQAYIQSDKLFSIWTLVDKPNTMNILDQKLNKEAVKELYQLIHRREPDQEGLDYWNGKTLRQMLDGMKGSEEFARYSDVFEAVKRIENWAKDRGYADASYFSDIDGMPIKTEGTGRLNCN